MPSSPTSDLHAAAEPPDERKESLQGSRPRCTLHDNLKRVPYVQVTTSDSDEIDQQGNPQLDVDLLRLHRSEHVYAIVPPLIRAGFASETEVARNGHVATAVNGMRILAHGNLGDKMQLHSATLIRSIIPQRAVTDHGVRAPFLRHYRLWVHAERSINTYR